MMIDFDTKPVLKRIKPSAEEKKHLQDTISWMKQLIFSKAQEKDQDVEVIPGGSTAKGTFLKGDFDVDMFVRFRSDSKDLSDELESILSSISEQEGFSLERVHGSRDYFTFTARGCFFEIVPVKYITDPKHAENVTDMSPLHIIWSEKRLTEEKRDDIRLAKQFCKANGVYGAESYIKGFSGHVLEILVIHHGGFEALLENASEWKKKEVIDPAGHHDNPQKALNESKQQSPLILVDPVDPQRNAAAALSKERYDHFKTQAHRFLTNPSEDFFTIPHFKREKVINQHKENDILFIITITPQSGKKDVVGAKILQVYKHLKRQLELHEFNIKHSAWWFDEEESHIALFVDNTPLSETRLHQGPPVSRTQAAERFKTMHNNVFEKEGVWVARVAREYTDAETCIRQLLNGTYISERVKAHSLETIRE